MNGVLGSYGKRYCTVPFLHLAIFIDRVFVFHAVIPEVKDLKVKVIDNDYGNDDYKVMMIMVMMSFKLCETCFLSVKTLSFFMKEKLFDHLQIVQSQFEAKFELSKNRSKIAGVPLVSLYHLIKNFKLCETLLSVKTLYFHEREAF